MGRDVKSVGLFRAPRVSIHAPAWGATPRGRGSGRCWCGFNPRARVGRDKSQPRHSRSCGSFNPRARVGRDGAILGEPWRDGEFQSTRPRGARPTGSTHPGARPWFQSTRPRGARQVPQRACGVLAQFQSTRPRGARRWRQGVKPKLTKVSIHAPAWGATRGCQAVLLLIRRFNPRARVGRDFDALQVQVVGINVSIHAPAWGATSSS